MKTNLRPTFRRVFIKELAEDEPKKKRAMFKIRCEILGKFYNIVVDSRYTNNIILEEVVKKIKLKKIPHVNPYKVTCLNKGQGILVNEKTWVEFSIVVYKDRLLCNILPMHSFHLSPGRAWKFYRYVVYNGKEHSISFKKGGRTFKIQSLLEGKEPQ